MRPAAASLPAATARLATVYGEGQHNDLEGGVVAIFDEARRVGGPVVVPETGGPT